LKAVDSAVRTTDWDVRPTKHMKANQLPFNFLFLVPFSAP